MPVIVDVRGRDQMEDVGVDGTKKLKRIFKKDTTKLSQNCISKFVTVHAGRAYRALASTIFRAKGHTRYCGLVRGSHVEK
jgi:hypothetical protein